MPETTIITINLLHANYDESIRPVESFGIEANPELTVRLMMDGFDASQPITVKRINDVGYFGFRVVHGFVRFALMTHLNTWVRELGGSAPFHEIPCIVID